eukprot:3797216-Rhodomonas_salina.1
MESSGRTPLFIFIPITNSITVSTSKQRAQAVEKPRVARVRRVEAAKLRPLACESVPGVPGYPSSRGLGGVHSRCDSVLPRDDSPSNG